MKKNIFEWFELINSIPRGSDNEKEVVQYIERICNQENLETKVDSFWNIVIKKKGTLGYENSPAIILQGHTDMVCEKNKKTNHDFLKDPIKIIKDGNLLKADGTTLGADNGIAVAYILSILFDKDIEHPPIEAILTSGEEIGLVGANRFNNDFFNLKGKKLINIDSEDEGVVTVGCASGSRIIMSASIEKEPIVDDYYFFHLFLSDLKGGHSGVDINKGLGNSNVILGRVIHEVQKNTELRIISFDGGGLPNAIPRESEVILAVKDAQIMKTVVRNFMEVIKKELKDVDDLLELNIEESQPFKEGYSSQFVSNLLTGLFLLPCGVLEMSPHIEGLVEVSCNLSSLKEKDNELVITLSPRSSVNSKKDRVVESIKLLGETIGFKVVEDSSYPAWEYQKDSELRDIAMKVYEEMYHKKMIIETIHGGLECGILSTKMDENLDMISIGPNIRYPHTPNEYMEIDSAQRVYEYLVELLTYLK